MRTLFVLCTAVTVFQIFDVSITGVVAVTGATPPAGTANPTTNAAASKTTTRALKNSKAPPKDPNPADNQPGTNPDDDDSGEAEPPKSIKESGQRAAKTLKKVASQRGAGLINGFTGLLKNSNGAVNFFGNFLRDRSNNVKDVAKESLGLVSSFSDSSSRGAKHLINSGRTIGTQTGKEMFNALQKATKLGTNVTKFGGTVVGTPLSIGEDLVGTANKVAKVPSRLSKIATNVAINPVLGYLGVGTEEEDGEEAEEENQKQQEPPQAATPSPPKPKKTPAKKP